MNWMYGITTVPERKGVLFPRTLLSLRKAGFELPRLFVDGVRDGYEEFDLPTTYRYPTIRTAANWILALLELYHRMPNADRFAIFQDDFVTYRNLRAYLEKTPYPSTDNVKAGLFKHPGFLNLYTMPSNNRFLEKEVLEGRLPSIPSGFTLSHQFGRGAVALVFDRDATMRLLASWHLVERTQDQHRGWRSIDGGIMESMMQANWKEYIHMPSLVQHTGILTSMRSKPQPLAEDFRGEDFDALELSCSAALAIQ